MSVKSVVNGWTCEGCGVNRNEVTQVWADCQCGCTHKDKATGEPLTKISNWNVNEGEKIALFQAQTGAKFWMYSVDVVKA
jgi:hypothetical protein